MGLRGPKPKRREVVWSPELAYAVGLIASDGCLLNDGRHLDFTSIDIEQIKNISRCLGLGHIKIGTKNEGTAFRLQWGDVTLYNFFLSIGLMPNKSRRIGALQIPEHLFFDFLRGSFDGDGSFYSYYDPRWKSSFMYYLSFNSASASHIAWLRTTLKHLLNVEGHISRTKNSCLESLRFAKREALVVLGAMYSTGCNTHLKRKRLKIGRALRILGKSLPKQAGR
jgi:hypothetical protein